MSKRPLNSVKGYRAYSAFGVGSTGIFSYNYSENTAAVKFDSTGNVSLPGALALNGGANDITQDSTGDVTFPGDIKIGSHTLGSNSTGLTIGTNQISVS